MMDGRYGFGCALGAALLASAAPSGAAVVNQWVQFAPNDTVLIRAIEDTPSNGCPAATLDGAPLTLSQRGTVTTAAQAPKTYYPILMCESAPVPAFGHASASVAGVALKMPVAKPRDPGDVGHPGLQ